MSIRIPVALAIKPATSSSQNVPPRLAHGDLLLGKIARVDSDGTATIKFAGFEARTNPDAYLQPGRQVFAFIQKSGGETSLVLLPGIDEGEILTGTLARGAAQETLVRVGEFDARVRLPEPDAAPPPAGTRVHVQPQKLSGKPVFQMLPSDAGEQATLSGTVVTQRSDGTTLLAIGGTVLIASSAEHLEAGDGVQAKMLREKNRVLLRIIQKGTSSGETVSTPGLLEGLERLLTSPQYAPLLDALVSGEFNIDAGSRELLQLLQQLLAQRSDGTEWASALAASLRTILLAPGETGFVDQVAGALTNSGVFFESRSLEASLAGELDTTLLDDLKLTLLTAKQKLSAMLPQAREEGGDAPALLAEIAARVNRLLDILTATQIYNLRLAPSRQFYIQLPCAPGSGLEQVELRIADHGKQGKRRIDARNVSLTLAVSTSNLGRIKAALSIVDGQVNCQFRAEKEPIVTLLNKSVDILKRGFEKLHYRVAHIGCMLCGDERDLSIFEDIPMIPAKGFDVQA